MRKKHIKVQITVIIIFSIILGFSIKYVSFGNPYKTKSNQQKLISYGSKEQTIIALTFDDGPHPKYTTEILDLLNEYNIKATFFVLGKFAEQYPEIIKRQAKEGHEIGNHTYSHINVKKVSKEKIQEEFNKTQEIILSLAGVESKVFRPPYGIFDEKIISAINKACSIVLWSQNEDHKDWSNPGVKKIADTILSQIENGDIILLHDYVYHNESHTVEALKIILPELKNKGYKFVTLSELIEISK